MIAILARATLSAPKLRHYSSGSLPSVGRVGEGGGEAHAASPLANPSRQGEGPNRELLARRMYSPEKLAYFGHRANTPLSNRRPSAVFKNNSPVAGG